MTRLSDQHPATTGARALSRSSLYATLEEMVLGAFAASEARDELSAGERMRAQLHVGAAEGSIGNWVMRATIAIVFIAASTISGAAQEFMAPAGAVRPIER
jgi:hypothetical protein